MTNKQKSKIKMPNKSNLAGKQISDNGTNLEVAMLKKLINDLVAYICRNWDVRFYYIDLTRLLIKNKLLMSNVILQTICVAL